MVTGFLSGQLWIIIHRRVSLSSRKKLKNSPICAIFIVLKYIRRELFEYVIFGKLFG